MYLLSFILLYIASMMLVPMHVLVSLCLIVSVCADCEQRQNSAVVVKECATSKRGMKMNQTITKKCNKQVVTHNNKRTDSQYTYSE